MNQLKFSLGWYILSSIKERINVERFISQTIDAVDEDKNKYTIHIYSGQFVVEFDTLQIHYWELNQEQIYCVAFKKGTQPWYAIRIESEECLFLRKQESWRNCSLLEQLRLGYSFQILFESGLTMEGLKDLFPSKLVFEVLEKE